MRMSVWSADVCSPDLERLRVERQIGRHRTAIVWCARRRDAPAYLALDPEAFEAELQRRCGERLGTVRLVGRRFSYPLSGLHARSYVADRVALIDRKSTRLNSSH